MKKILVIVSFLFLVMAFALSVKAQEWNVGLDIYSSYVWRGTKFGSGPAFQPSVEFAAGGFAIGGWGSFNASANESPEADLYTGYTFELGKNSSLGLTLTDYYFPGTNWFEGKSHFIEPMLSLGLGNFSLTGAYMMNDGAGDIYMEAGLTAGVVDLILGGGDGAYTVDGKFNICNISIGSSKKIKITDTFSIPLSGSVVFNPSSEQLYIIAGISL